MDYISRYSVETVRKHEKENLFTFHISVIATRSVIFISNFVNKRVNAEHLMHKKQSCERNGNIDLQSVQVVTSTVSL
jgi:hypothetical protein